MNQPVNLQERRRESAIAEIRVIQRIGIRTGIGKWVWQDFELSPAQAAAVVGTPEPQPEHRRQAPPMNMGRDPAKHFIAISPKFDIHNMTVEDAFQEFGGDKLSDFVDWARRKEKRGEQLSAGLEVTCEMIEAYLIEREFVPTPKNKGPRRESREKWNYEKGIGGQVTELAGRVRLIIREELSLGPISTLALRLEKRFLDLIEELKQGGK